MIALMYCPELNIYRFRSILDRKTFTKTQAELEAMAKGAPWLLDRATERRADPNVEEVIAT